jgi:shikimate kinase
MVIPSHKPIVLLGFMGSGKSTLGKQLAKHLRWRFTDLDKIIENDSGMTIPGLFSRQGEEAFRKIEAEALGRVIDHPFQVIAIGGGTPCQPGNMDLIRQKSLSIYLKISEKELASRLLTSATPRPLLDGKNEEEIGQFIHKLLEKREVDYLRADIIVESDSLQVGELLSRLETA